MKKILCLVLCLLSVAALFVGCKTDSVTPVTEAPTQATVPVLTEAVVTGINYCGLAAKGVTVDALAAAVGVDASAVISTKTGADEELLIINDVMYNDISYKQLQCINYEDKSVVTLTYIADGETAEEACTTISDSFGDSFGEPSVSESSSGSSTYTWRVSSVNTNYIIVYPINETELKVSFYLYG